MNPTLRDPIFAFLNGAIFMGAAACGIFFFRFWRKARDRLFLIFGTAFWIMAAERLLFLLADPWVEDHAAIFGFRISAYLTILYGIWDKNRASSSEPAYRAKAG